MTSADGALWVQRVADPGPASDFSPWTRLDTAATACNVAVCSHGASVLVFFRDSSNPRVVRVRESADSGRTWAPRRTAATLASGTVDWLATSFSSAGTPALFLAANDGRLHVTTRTGATWSALDAQDYALADITGLACAADTAWRLAVTGTDATGRHRLWSASYDGAWSPLLEITRADAGSGVTFDAPFLRARRSRPTRRRPPPLRRRALHRRGRLPSPPHVQRPRRHALRRQLLGRPRPLPRRCPLRRRRRGHR